MRELWGDAGSDVEGVFYLLIEVNERRNEYLLGKNLFQLISFMATDYVSVKVLLFCSSGLIWCD